MTSCPGVLGTDLNVWKSIYEKIAFLKLAQSKKDVRYSILVYAAKNWRGYCTYRCDFMAEMCTVYCTMSAEGPVVELTSADIPRVNLSTPYEQHTVAALRWWLLCRGIQASTSLRKKQLIDRCDYSIDTIHYSNTEFEQLFKCFAE